MAERNFRARYGRWALIAGASEGLGAAFAEELGAQGLDLVLLARRADKLEAVAAQVRARCGVAVHTAAVDLAAADLREQVRAAVGDREVGLLVYNAAHSTIGPFLEQPVEALTRTIDVNCRGPVILAHELGRAMAARRRGGIVLMASLAGTQGSALLATYAASKAFDLVLAEALWAELREAGVDVLACRAGATRTPNYLQTKPRASAPAMEPEEVVREALGALGRGPSVVTGVTNRLAAFVLGRVLPRRAAVALMARQMKKMYGRE